MNRTVDYSLQNWPITARVLTDRYNEHFDVKFLRFFLKIFALTITKEIPEKAC